MGEFYREGGWGMFPVMLAVLLPGSQPASRLFTLAGLTLGAGGLWASAWGDEHRAGGRRL